MLGGQGWAQHHHEHSGDGRFRAARNAAAVGQSLHPREALPFKGEGGEQASLSPLMCL